MRVAWRPALIYTHRWLGIAGCIIFFAWFVSGVVMMYQRMPRLTAEERLARLPPLDLSTLRVPLEDAVARADVSPDRARLSSFAGRPVYRLLAAGQWSTLFADTGEVLPPLSAAEALDVARQFVPEHAATLRYDALLTRPDQWTIDGGLPRFLPLHRIALGDRDGTDVYVSDRTGEVVMKTTASGRAWGYAGAVLHWTYFTPFRLQPGLWRWSIIYAALIGCVMCLSGLVIGIWRYSLSRRFRLKGERSHSPYAGLMWWHHYAGLVFGVFTFTWALSGALSLTPWDWAPSASPSHDEVLGAMGGPLKVEAISVPALRDAVGTISRDFAPREIELLQFRGQPFLLAYRPLPMDAARASRNPDLRAFHSATLALDRRLLRIDGDRATTFDRFSDADARAAAIAARPDVAIRDAVWLDDYDDYYYDRYRMSPLPVLRVRFNDPTETWLYVSPTHGALVMKQERLSRLNRWVYNGLHSLDFRLLINHRPLWDIVMIVLSLGGIGLTVTTVVPAWRRLRRNAARWRPSR